MKFQVRFVVLHRLHPSPWAYASLPLASHSASSLRLWFSFPFCLCGLSFLCGDVERSLTRPCGSTAADSSSADGGTCTSARSRDLDPSGSVAGSWISSG